MMPPDWLAIPAVEPDPRRRPNRFGSEGRLLNPVRDGGGRLLLFVSDPAIAFDVRRVLGARLGAARLDGIEAILHEPMGGRAEDPIEVVDPGTLRLDSPALGGGMDRHSLDVALSVGRHAAERAKLAGCVRLTGVGVGGSGVPGGGDAIQHRARGAIARAEGFADRNSARQAGVPESRAMAYDALRRLGRFEIAALVGAAIASAQMGLGVSLRGTAGAIAGPLALALNAGVGDWLNGADAFGPLWREGAPARVTSWRDALARSSVVDSRADLVG